MLKASAYPYPLFEAVQYELMNATFEERQLERHNASRKIVVDGQHLRRQGRGTVSIVAKILTTPTEVAQHVLGNNRDHDATAGFRVLCEASKYRTLQRATPGANTTIELPLEKLRGSVTITPVFTTVRDCLALDGSSIVEGAVIALSGEPVVVVIDEDWLGDVIPIRWVDFAAMEPSLPGEAFIYVQLPASGELCPEGWLNQKFRTDIESVLNHGMLNSAQGISGHLLRQLVWLRIWQAVLPWAIRHESEENENWPSSRIARMWRARFGKHDWDLPTRDELDLGTAEELTVKIQHCLNFGDELARVRDVWRF